MSPRKDSERLPELIARCALGDPAAFTSLYRATAPKLYGVALQLLKREAWAEEALQESYIKIWRNAGSFNPDKGSPMTWMICIVRNQSLDIARKTECRAHEVEWKAETDPRRSGDDPALRAEVSRELARLRQCLARLTDRQRCCILLIHHQGFTPTELARSLGVPLGTVKTWVRRGLIRLRECLRS